MGCSKNLVDSEALMRLLGRKGYDVHHDADSPSGEYVIVNTCGFIGDAKEESINTILELTEAKATGQIGNLYVMGCLAERFMADLVQELPEVDKFYGKFNWKDLLHDLGKSYDYSISNERFLTTPSQYPYIKISEGCNRFCAFCAIPLITGRHQSVPMETLLSEVKPLVQFSKNLNILFFSLRELISSLYSSLFLMASSPRPIFF